MTRLRWLLLFCAILCACDAPIVIVVVVSKLPPTTKFLRASAIVNRSGMTEEKIPPDKAKLSAQAALARTPPQFRLGLRFGVADVTQGVTVNVKAFDDKECLVAVGSSNTTVPEMNQELSLVLEPRDGCVKECDLVLFPAVVSSAGGTDVSLTGCGFPEQGFAVCLADVKVNNLRRLSSGQINFTTLKRTLTRSEDQFVRINLGDRCDQPTALSLRYYRDAVTFNPVTHTVSSVVALAAGRVDDDMFTDLALAISTGTLRSGEDSVGLLLGDLTSGPRTAQSQSGLTNAKVVGLGAISKPGNRLEVVVNSNDALRLYDGKLVTAGINVKLTQLPRALLVSDIDGDGMDDLVSITIIDNAVLAHFSNGMSQFEPSSPFPPPKLPFAISALNMLGKNSQRRLLDIAIGNLDGTIDLWQQTTARRFEATISFPAAKLGTTRITALSSADMDDDGLPDLVVADRNGGVIILINDGKSGFQPLAPLSIETPLAVSIADFDGDSRPDVVAASANASILLWRNLGQGKFAQPLSWKTSLSPGSPPTALLATDLNNDGFPDIVVGTSISVHVFVNSPGPQ